MSGLMSGEERETFCCL